MKMQELRSETWYLRGIMSDFKNQCFDKKGIPIRAGDVLKVFHFVGARNKKHYMYKMVWELSLIIDGKPNVKVLMADHLSLHTSINGCSTLTSYKLPSGVLEDYEIVQGYNNEGDELDFNDRKRMENL